MQYLVPERRWMEGRKEGRRLLYKNSKRQSMVVIIDLALTSVGATVELSNGSCRVSERC